jgi:hypothetical protein
MCFAEGVRGPGLFAVDLRRSEGLRRDKPGMFALSFMLFGPNGRDPGPPVTIDSIRATSQSTDLIDVTLLDAQKENEAGHGYLSLGDTLRFTLTTSEPVEDVTFRIVVGRTGEPLRLDGRTEFRAHTDADAKGQAWSADVLVSGDCDTSFKTWYEKAGRIRTGRDRTHVVADVTGGDHDRLIGMMPCGVDLTVAPMGPKTVAELLSGKVLLESAFDSPSPDGWTPIAGDEWVRLRGRFGDLSDSPGPDELGNWAVNGETWWDDYRFSADMAEELDGAGSVFLAVRFQDPANYYALEWLAQRGDTVRLVRCKEGHRYTIAESEGHDLSAFPFTVSVAVSGDFLAGFINDQQVVTGFAGDFEKGRIALGEMGRKVLVDNVKVERIVSEAKTSTFLRNCTFDYGWTPRCFLRATGGLAVPFVLRNTGDEPFDQVHVRISFGAVAEPAYLTPAADEYFPAISRQVQTLAPGQSVVVEFPMDTRLLKSGDYQFSTQVSVPREGLVRDEVVRIGIARNWNPERFNYFTWGLPRDEETLVDYAAHGHTMGIGGGRATPLEWEYGGKRVPPEAQPKKLGGKTGHGIIGGTNLQTNHGSFFPETVYGLNRTGDETKPTRLPLPYAQAFHDFSVNLARTYAERFSPYPAYQLMNINTETEYHNHPDVSEMGLARLPEQFNGHIPDGCENMFGFPHTEKPGMAVDGIIDDDNEALRFYRWFWTEGEAFNRLALDMKNAVKDVAPDMTVFHDPAARMPFFRDRHDGINPWDWTYTTPNALTLPFKIEVLRAMAEPDNDRITNYVQVLWKQWTVGDVNLCPSAAIIRLGLLHSASRPVYAVGHWNTGWMTEEPNRDRWEGVKDLYDTLWKPVGPVLTNLREDAPREVALLVSHTNQLFSVRFRGTWQVEPAFAGWHEAFLRAGLPVDIIFEESVAEGALSRYKALFIPFGEVISRSAYDGIVKFARQGGRVVADANLGYNVPGAVALKSTMDHLLWPNWGWYRLRHGNGVTADQRIELMWQAVDEIGTTFADERSRVPTPDSPWLVVNERRWNDTRYIYAVNDRRSAGAAGRKWGTILENGEPLDATITVPGEKETVYDLVAHRSVPVERANGMLNWQSHYEPASARVFALLPTLIASVTLNAPEQIERGTSGAVRVGILDPQGKPVTGLVPIRLTIRDGQGALSEYSDTFAVKNGAFERTIWIALNDTGGTWTVTVDDLASGKSATAYVRVPVRALPRPETR